ncbi:ATP-binding protein [Streptomyces sp. DT24]|uniref:ATP-binding protein n=1 Tax=unclassified Streptomyces TaxID=2593676 RepID=UPI003CECAB58
MSGENETAPRSVLPFEAGPQTLRGLRRLVRDQLGDWGLPDFADEAELAVSELAANVFKHVRADAAAALVLEPKGDRLRIEVHDTSRSLPTPRTANDDDECGRGLCLLDGLAADWGTELTRTGKKVWCELSAAPESRCRRVLRAESALTRYRHRIGSPELLRSRSAQLLEESATVLIADLLHWTAARGGDPDGLLDRAQMHFEAETV